MFTGTRSVLLDPFITPYIPLEDFVNTLLRSVLPAIVEVMSTRPVLRRPLALRPQFARINELLRRDLRETAELPQITEIVDGSTALKVIVRKRLRRTRPRSSHVASIQAYK
jgi:hypothetical protein